MVLIVIFEVAEIIFFRNALNIKINRAVEEIILAVVKM
jgi:hypothetical protein